MSGHGYGPWSYEDYIWARIGAYPDSSQLAVDEKAREASAEGVDVPEPEDAKKPRRRVARRSSLPEAATG